MKKQNNAPQWQNAWLDELDKKTPPLAEYVKNEPIPKCEKNQSIWQRFLQRLSELMADNRVKASVGALAMLVLIISAVLVFRPAKTADFSNTVVALEINPAVLMSTDKDGNVCQAVALNEDADAVLALDEFTGMVIGKPLPEALAAYTDMCARLGFISYTGDAVRLSSVDTDISSAENALSGYFKENGILAVIDAQTKAEADFEKMYGINTGDGTLYDAVGSMERFYSVRCSEGKEFSELLEDYRNNILSAVQLYIKEEIEAAIADISGQDPMLAEILRGILDELIESTGELIEFIRYIETSTNDYDTISSALEGLASEPESSEEYFEKMSGYRKYRADELKAKHASKYSEHRNRIDDDYYEDYIESIIKEYGSLHEYYERHNG